MRIRSLAGCGLPGSAGSFFNHQCESVRKKLFLQCVLYARPDVCPVTSEVGGAYIKSHMCAIGWTEIRANWAVCIQIHEIAAIEAD